MLKSLQTNFKLKNLIVVFLTPILLLGFLVESAHAAGTDHAVISEIQIAGVTADDEFIELYNPTDQEINLTGYSLKKKTKTGTESVLVANSYFQDMVIKPHGYLLLTHKESYQGSAPSNIEWPKSYSLSSDNAILLYNDKGVVSDKVGWGASADFEAAAFLENPLAGQSLERKSGIDSTRDTLASGADKFFGNGWDMDNNSMDFVLQTISNPQNSASPIEPAIENSQAPASSPIPPSTPSSNPVASISPVSKSFPVAEAGADREAVIGENIDFDGSDSFDSTGKDLIFSWDFGDKTGAKGINVSHIYNAIGEYNVILKVNNGENISEDSLKLKIIAPEFSDKIILSEILPNPPGADKDGEWIELFNSGDKRVNLLGWILSSSAKTSGKQYVFSGDRFIEPKKFLAIKRSESGLVLANEGGKVSLIWPADKILSEVSYGSAKDGKSYAFINNSWQWADIPTPNKENSAKSFAASSKENIATLADISKNINGQEGAGGEGEAIGDIAINSLLARSAVSQLEKSFSIEDFLNQLISEKVNNAISKAKANDTDLPEKVSLLADNAGGEGIAGIDQESACKDFCAESERNASNRQKDVRNNPWFYGDIALSILSLFLVWRYQEVRKKLKLS
ncbi:MAG: lamin tail domain-containing protein [bacterium]|nr:lamin tail domain-containing protein [bacterium]